jgi:glycosyltransferase involved in cell wall biosynthesis
MTGNSGISKYASRFYELILKPKGYVHVDSEDSLTSIFTRVSSQDTVHIEIGLFQNKEIAILLLMLKAGYKNVSITLHDAPLLKYPLKSFANPILNNFSKFYDRYISGFKNATPYIRNINTIYVLSYKGLQASSKIYKTNNFIFLPHIVDLQEKVIHPAASNRNFLYLGFIGKNKGLEYALKLHADIVRQNPGVQFYIAGTAIGKQMKYFNYLKKKYVRNVHFLGYVPDEELNRIYQRTRFALLLFKDYRFFYPASGSILTCMNHGKIVFTNRVNTIPEIISDCENGVFLSGQQKEDLKKITALLDNPDLQDKISENALTYLNAAHNTAMVEEHYIFPVSVKNH